MKEMWGLPPHFGIYPIHLLEMGLPLHLRDTYNILYTLGWRTEFRTVQQSVQQLADLFSVIQDKEIQPRGMRKRLQELSELGLVERSKRDGRWLTVLKLRHPGSAPSTGTGRVTWAGQVAPPGSGSDPPGVPHLDKSIVGVVNHDSLNQQQQDSRSGTDVERNEELLAEMGVVGGVRYRLAKETWVTPDYLEAIREYKASEAAKGNTLGAGWVVKFVGEKCPAPEVQAAEPDRYRYVQGKYKDYIKH